MIIDNIRNKKDYLALGGYIAKALEMMPSFTPDTECGERELDGKNFTVNVFVAEGGPVSERTFEAHSKYIDVHYIIEGDEVIQYADLARTTQCEPYNEKNDSARYQGPEACTSYTLHAGDFYIMFPQDAHRGGAKDGETISRKKAVFKVLYK